MTTEANESTTLYVCVRCNHSATGAPSFITRQTEATDALTADAQALGKNIVYGLCELCEQSADLHRTGGRQEYSGWAMIPPAE